MSVIQTTVLAAAHLFQSPEHTCNLLDEIKYNKDTSVDCSCLAFALLRLKASGRTPSRGNQPQRCYEGD